MMKLPVSSQIVFIIENERYSCYTDWENREIAKLLIEGERSDSLLRLCTITLKEERDKANTYKSLYIESTNINNTLLNSLDDCLLLVNEYKDVYETTDKQLKTRTNLLYGSVGLNLLLTILIIIL